jgi:hypothetical protein
MLRYIFINYNLLLKYILIIIHNNYKKKYLKKFFFLKLTLLQTQKPESRGPEHSTSHSKRQNNPHHKTRGVALQFAPNYRDISYSLPVTILTEQFLSRMTVPTTTALGTVSRAAATAAAGGGGGSKKVMITGVGKGLGRALALELDKRGHIVIGCSRSQDNLNSLQSQFSSDKHLLLDADVVLYYHLYLLFFNFLNQSINN